MKLLLILLAVLYALSPYDVLPDFLVGWGWLDDIVVLGLLWRYLNRQRKKSASYREKGVPGKDTGRPAADPHEVLGVRPGAAQQEIRQAYRELAGKYHPDKVDHLGKEFKALAEERFKEIQAAYDALKKANG